MIKLDITARNFEADAAIKDYVEDKVGGLERFIPRQMRASAYATVTLFEDASGREDNRFVCEAILHVEGHQFMATEGTLNMYAAADIVEAKLKAQLSDFKDKVARPHRGKGVVERLLRRDEAADIDTSAP